MTEKQEIHENILPDDNLLPLRERALNAIREGVVIVDAQQKDNPIIYANDGFLEITGYSRDEVLGQNCRFLQGPETDEENVRIIRQAVEQGEAVTQTILNYTKDGEAFYNALSISPIYHDGTLTHFVGTQRDVTRRQELESRLAYQARHDDLTNLLNRSAFLKEAQNKHEESDTDSAILMIDLDHFKAINDNHGHLIGDQVLQHFASLLERDLRKDDIAGRYGGEEFAALLPQTDQTTAYSVAESLRRLVEQTTFENDIDMTISIGIGLLEPEDAFDEGLEQADRALYAAKEAGRNTIIGSSDFQDKR